MKAHFDGRVIVPDEPVDLPVNAPLELHVDKVNGVSAAVAAAETAAKDPKVIARKLAAFERFLERSSKRPGGPGIPDEMLRREHIYGDDGR